MQLAADKMMAFQVGGGMRQRGEEMNQAPADTWPGSSTAPRPAGQHPEWQEGQK